jgi:TRAP-type C4-dicarboxylate transport system permease small subunit
MRRILDHLYRFSGAVAAMCLVAICLIVVAQVGGRVIDGIATLITGDRIGLLVPSAAEFSGFFLAAASFLALAYTFRHDGHIRVSLVITRFTGRTRHWIELWCLTFAACLTGFFSWHTILLVLDSMEYDEVSYGMIPVPLWIPQSFMAFGLIVLTVALLDDLVRVIGGDKPSYENVEQGLMSE